MKTTFANVIAYALIDLGVEVVTHVPGYGGSETFQAFNELSMRNNKFSFHEEAAYTIAHSASICGKRSASLMKAHGLMKAANSVIDSLYSEITAGFVTIIFEDKSGKHSDNILELTPILNGLPLRFIQSSSITIYSDVIQAYEESERIKLPVALLIDASEVKNEIFFEQKNNLKKKYSYKRDVYQHVVHPMLSDYQYKVFLAKKFDGNRTAIQRPDLPVVPVDFPERAKNTAIKYAPLFDVFKNYRGDIVTGDTSGLSAFAFPPYECVDIVTYMGGAIPLAIGAYLSGYKNVWALSGDFGFVSAGMIGLVELINREIPIKVLLFYNKQAAATGGQLINKKILLHMLAGFEKSILHIANPLDPFEVETVFREANNSKEFKLIIADYPE
ncbi:MAG: thiamine pyrophosphate-dependent enzyme [Bacteroidota bacterium]